jgi:hypothetical protein
LPSASIRHRSGGFAVFEHPGHAQILASHGAAGARNHRGQPVDGVPTDARDLAVQACGLEVGFGAILGTAWFLAGLATAAFQLTHLRGQRSVVLNPSSIADDGKLFDARIHPKNRAGVFR